MNGYSRNRITTTKLRTLFTTLPLAGAIKDVEDPFPNLFVDEVPFFEGAYRVFPGPIAGTSFQFRRLTESIFHPKEEWPKDFLRQAFHIVRGILAISEVLADRIGIERGTAGDSSEKGDVTVPSSRKLHHLKEAVSFSRREFESFLGSVGVDAHEVHRLIVQAGSFGADAYSVDDGVLLHKPLVACDETLVVAAPQRLLSATNYLLSDLIVHAGLRNTFSENYPRAIERSAHRSLEFLRHVPMDFPLADQLRIDGVRERFYRFDSDKILYLLVLCDTLDRFDKPTIDGSLWSSPHLSRSVVERVKFVSQELFRLETFVNEILVLLVPSAVTRIPDPAFETWPETALLLVVAPDNLEVIAQAEAGNPLALWRFAQKSREAQQQRRLLYFDELDLFTAYRDHSYGYSVHATEDPIPILVKPGYATKLKVKQANEQDWHPVRYLEPRFIVNVNTLYGDRAIPLYANPDSRLPCICVEGLPCLVWVYPAQEVRESERSTYFELVTAVAYWIWQISLFLKQIVKDEMQSLSMMHMRVSACAALLKSIPVLVESETSVSCSTPSVSMVDIFFDDGFAFLMRIPDNSAERELLRRLLPCLVQATGAAFTVTKEQTDNIVDQVAPLGFKRMLLHTDVSTVPQMDPRDLPPYRKIQTGEVEDVINEISRRVVNAGGLKTGQLEPPISGATLNEMVGHCFNELVQIVKTLKPDRLLESLITFNESLIRESAFTSLTVASRMTTFDQNEHFAAKLAREMAELAEAGTASRFLIEYVAAQPPRGMRPMSLSVYDRLQAVAREIIRLGSLSDCCHFSLCSVELSVLPSGRIKADSMPYLAAQGTQILSLAFDQVVGSNDVFLEHLGRRLETVDLPPEEAEINLATKAEFGHSISDLVRFLTALGDVSMDMTPITPSVMERCKLFSALVPLLNWPEDKIDSCVELFSLAPRNPYLDGVNCKKVDVYPWRFNRAISYLRRPLITRPKDGKSDILWGHRNLDSSRGYLVGLCSSTRLKATSPQMRSLLARFRHEAGTQFNNSVYEVLRGNPRLVVRKRVSTFGNLRLDNLGDIDVLSAESDKRVLWVIECKSLAACRTPYEMSMHLRELTIGDGTNPSIVKRHEARSDWIKKHLGFVLGSMGITFELGWKVQPLLVLDSTPLSPLFKEMSIPVISLDMLRSRWNVS